MRRRTTGTSRAGSPTRSGWERSTSRRRARSTPPGRALGRPARAAYVGNEVERAELAGLALNPSPLAARLDWVRSYKDDYELRCLEEATVLGARGHGAAREAFARGASELEVHHAFLAAVGATEAALPYPTIIATDEKAATLHYESQAHAPRRPLAAAGRRGRLPRLRLRHHAHDARPRLRPALRRADRPRRRARARAGVVPRRPAARTSSCSSQAHRGVAARAARPRRAARARRGGVREGPHPPVPAARRRPPPRDPGPRRGRPAGGPHGRARPASARAPVPAQHAADRAGPGVHDRARDLLHPDAAAAVPRRRARGGPSTGG